MNFDLAAMARRKRNIRRKQIVLPVIQPTAAMAAGLYAAVYKPIIAGWLQRLDGIEAAYARALPAKVGDGLIRDSADDAQAALNAAEAWVTRIILAITPAVRDWAFQTEKWQRGKWVGSVLTATGIDLSTILTQGDVSDTVGAFLQRNVGLVRSVSDQTRARIADVVLRNYQARVPARQVAKEMAEAVEISRARALRIAADQSSKLSGRLDQARQEQAGVKKFTYRSSHKRHPRSWHAARDGKTYTSQTLQQVGGPDHIAAGDGPTEPPFCGCRRQALLSFD